MREVSRFGHAAKVWLGIIGCGYLGILFLGLGQIEEGWTGVFWLVIVWTIIAAVQLWIQTSQRVWYDDQQVCTRILGKERECIRFADVTSVSASHSWRRAAADRPISELQITARNGRSILISLRHLSIAGLQDMVDEIHRRTGLEVPELRKSVR